MTGSLLRYWPLAAALAFGACGDVEIKPDSRSGDDFEQAGASQLFFDKLTDDFVDGVNGDNTDWKYMKVPAKGFLKITVFWDTKDVDATVEVRDRFRAIVQQWTHSKELEKDEQEMKVEPGTHYIVFHVGKKASVYTAEAHFDAFDTDATDEAIPEATGADDLLGEPIPDAMPEEVPGRPRPRPAAGTPRPAAPKPAGGGGAIEATIFRMVPGPNGKGALVTIDAGEDKGVRVNDKGTISCGSAGGSWPLVIKKVNPRTSTAETATNPNQITNCRFVKVNTQ